MDLPAATPAVIDLPDADATARLGRWLARQLGAGDTLLLEGEIGAGKTHLARSLIQARLAEFGAVEDVPSPSFTLVQTYEAGSVEIWHADLYRLGIPDEIAELGLDAAFGQALCLVEWPGKLGPWRPRRAITLRLTPSGEGRRAELSGRADLEARLTEALCDD